MMINPYLKHGGLCKPTYKQMVAKDFQGNTISPSPRFRDQVLRIVNKNLEERDDLGPTPPNQDAIVTTRAMTFLVGNLNLNLHLQLAAWVGGRSKGWSFENNQNINPKMLTAPFCSRGFGEGFGAL